MKLRHALIVVFAALAAAPAAAADGPGPYAQQDGIGVLSRSGALRYVAVGSNSNQVTLLEAVQTKDGEIRNWVDIAGSWGLPAIIPGGAGDSLSHDGKTLVLGQTVYGAPSSFLVYDARTLRLKNWVALKGNFAFDALSPDASRLYLIQYLPAQYADLSHYIVRAYDLTRNRLLPGRIADRTQKSWVMNGYPMTRTTSADGRWVYTLYQNGGDGYPFIHALDTLRGVAHCVGLPITGGLYNVVLSLHGRTLSVHWRGGRPWLDVNTATWRVSPASGGFPWLWAGTGAGAALVLVGAGALALARRRRGEGLEQELAGLLRLPDREVVV